MLARIGDVEVWRIFGSGDVPHSTQHRALPDPSPVADHDPVLAAETRRAVFEQLSETGDLAFGSHIPPPSLGRNAAQGGALLWRPAI